LHLQRPVILVAVAAVGFPVRVTANYHPVAVARWQQLPHLGLLRLVVRLAPTCHSRRPHPMVALVALQYFAVPLIIADQQHFQAIVIQVTEVYSADVRVVGWAIEPKLVRQQALDLSLHFQPCQRQRLALPPLHHYCPVQLNQNFVEES